MGQIWRNLCLVAFSLVFITAANAAGSTGEKSQVSKGRRLGAEIVRRIRQWRDNLRGPVSHHRAEVRRLRRSFERILNGANERTTEDGTYRRYRDGASLDTLVLEKPDGTRFTIAPRQGLITSKYHSGGVQTQEVRHFDRHAFRRWRNRFEDENHDWAEQDYTVKKGPAKGGLFAKLLAGIGVIPNRHEVAGQQEREIARRDYIFREWSQGKSGHRTWRHQSVGVTESNGALVLNAYKKDIAVAQLVLRTPAAGELLRLRHDGFQLIWRADSFEITQELGGKPVSMLKIAKNNSDGVPLPPLPH